MSRRPAIIICDQSLVAAVARGGAWADVVTAATATQKAGSRTRARVKARADELGLDVSGLLNRNPSGPKPRWKDADLIREVPHATSWRGLGSLLGVTVGAGIQRRAKELGLDVSHLDDANHMTPPSAEPTTASRGKPEAIRVAAESIAAAWYLLHGYLVYEPKAGSPCVDLLAEKDGDRVRVQVKSTTSRTPNGAWQLRTVCFQGEGRNTARAYRDGDMDEVFAVTEDGGLYVLPAAVVIGHKVLMLGAKYQRYRVELFPE